MSTSRVVRSLVVAAGICVLVGAGPGGRVRGQQAAAADEPTFRTDASFVLTDVFVTADGKPVTDLTQADFEVREDGVVQTIRSFESVVHKPEPVGLPRRNPSTVAESNAMIGDPRRRVYVVFLDTYHVDRGSAMYMRKALQDFFATAFGADDLVAYMTPHMSGRDISFSSSTEPLIRFLDDNPAWGVADEIAGNESDPAERDLSTCFGDTKEQRQTWLGLRSRLREQKSIEAMRGLVTAPRRTPRIAQGGDRRDPRVASVHREPDARDRRGHDGPDHGRATARCRPGRSPRDARQRVQARNGTPGLRRPPRAGRDGGQPADVPGPDRRGESRQHELLHRRCRRPAGRGAGGGRPRRPKCSSRRGTASACPSRRVPTRFARWGARPTAWPSSTATTSRPACSASPTT